MSVHQDENGTYRVVYYHTNFEGKSVQSTKRGFTKKKDAVDFDNSMKKRSKKHKVDVGPMLLEDFVNKLYFPYMEDKLKKKSLVNKRHVIDTHILNVKNKPIASLKSMKLRDITADEIDAWQKAKQKEGYSDSYLLSIRKELSAILNFATTKYGWDDNPSKEVPRMGKFNTRVKKDDWWTVEEFDTFIQGVNKESKYYVIWNLLFYSGLRIGELLALKRDDISFENNSLYVDETYARLEREDSLTAPKTETSERAIYLPPQVMDILHDYLDKHPDIQGDDRIFPIVHRTVEKQLANEIRKRGLRHITVHSLRHSHVAYLKYIDVYDMGLIAQRLGHKDEVITSQVYAHVYDKAAMNLADMMQANIDARKKVE